ncbi:leucine-rich repeat neuronal protein 1-like [Stegodyphus dumicola]|uniref:leucine-rich repeat neuronal protein 1-like n=1 Tax=Stegodyphus dumicola TaxID=202533 RepID=UPI0015AB3272|nr:leucine-rich repeat neuronal protein 1-like [Stegodyphus dumicola]
MATKGSDTTKKRPQLLLWLFTFLSLILRSRTHTDLCDQVQPPVYCTCDVISRENTATCYIISRIQTDDSFWTSFEYSDVVSLNFRSYGDAVHLTFIPSDAVQKMSYLRTLSITEASLGTLKSNAIADLKSLRDLELERNEITGLERDAITRLPKLKKLALSENSLQELLAESLTELLELEQLFLDRNNISRIESCAFCELQNLKELELWGNQITDLTEYTFRGLRYLKRLDLYKNQIQILNDKIFQSMPNLLEIDLKNNLIHYISRTAFAGLDKLQRLMLNSNKIKMLHDEVFKPLSSLRSVDLYNNELELIQVQVVENMANAKEEQFSFTLKENPFKCDCGLLWVKIYMKEVKSPLFLRELKEMQCSNTEEKNSTLEIVHLLDLECSEISSTTKSRSMVTTSRSSIETTKQVPVQLQKSNKTSDIDNVYFSDDDDENSRYPGRSSCIASCYWTIFIVMLNLEFLRYHQKTYS